MNNNPSSLKKDWLIALAGGVGVIVLATVYYSLVLEHPTKSAVMPQEAPEIAQLEDAIKEKDAPLKNFLDLTSYYTQAVRETGDTAYFANVETVLDEAKKRFGKDDPDIQIAEAILAIGRHDFIEAEALATKAIITNPNSAHYYGVQSDALVELGRYEEAEQALQTMVDIRPDYGSYSRIAYLRELRGDTEGAVDLMQKALDSGSTIKEHEAWAEVEVGRLLFSANMPNAKRHFDKALVAVPDYTQSFLWLGKLAYAEGNKQKALEYFTKAYIAAPTITNAESLYAYAKAENDTELADSYAKIIDTAYRISQRQKNNVDLEYGRFLLEEGKVAEAETYAKSAHENRPNIYSAELMAKVSLAKNDVVAARKFSDESLKLDSNDASLFYTRALIEKASGDNKSMKLYAEKVRQLDPYFLKIHESALNEMLL